MDRWEWGNDRFIVEALDAERSDTGDKCTLKMVLRRAGNRRLYRCKVVVCRPRKGGTACWPRDCGQSAKKNGLQAIATL